jgi:hypothetical protein
MTEVRFNLVNFLVLWLRIFSFAHMPICSTYGETILQGIVFELLRQRSFVPRIWLKLKPAEMWHEFLSLRNLDHSIVAWLG